MRTAFLAFVAALLSTPAQAQGEAASHVHSAFISGADHGVLAPDVTLGPVLRRELGEKADPRKIYDSLVDRTAGKPLRVARVAASEAGTYASLPGVKPGEPFLRLEAGDVMLVLQYADKQRGIVFVERLGAAAPFEAAKPEVETPKQAPKPEPVTSVPLPTTPPAPPVAAPAPAAKIVAPAPAVAAPAPVVQSKPAPVVAKPSPTPPAAAPRAASVAAVVVPKQVEALRPRGECVIKPVMTDDDIYNCSAPTPSKTTMQRPAVVAEPSAGQAAIQAPKPRPQPDCVVKPVMTDDEIRACGAASRSSAAMQRPAVVVEPAAADAARIEPSKAKPRPECVIRPVMTDADLRACGINR